MAHSNVSWSNILDNVFVEKILFLGCKRYYIFSCGKFWEPVNTNFFTSAVNYMPTVINWIASFAFEQR